ncbi:MAG: glutamate-1-semialdehyde 2,1-aminomutase [Firmicutes bacterium]|nr:glutamate-1-semialdehyde 2,1-aminomutase [Bacillota bacterium]
MKTTRSSELFERAKLVMPGGVNSPVRAYRSVGMTPLFIERAKGNRIWDADGNEYIDFVGSWGPMILGHADDDVLAAIGERMQKGLSFGACAELEVELAELVVENIPHVERIRMVNSGTEATMSALRIARGYTGRNKIVKFEGCYHGHSDGLLVKAGSGAMTFGNPDSAGVTKGAAADTLVASYNDLDSVKALFAGNPGEIACVIVEPVAANMGVVPPAEGFLAGLRELCTKEGALLIIDEVITGFRLAFGGACQSLGIEPDLVTYGKIIGGGMPVGAYGGKKEIMETVSPTGPVYQAGTLSGNPIAMTAGLVTLKKLLADPSVYVHLNDMGERLAAGLREITGCTVNQIGSLVGLFLTDQPVRSYADAAKADTEKFTALFRGLLEEGVYIAPSPFESMFISAPFTEADVDQVLAAYRKVWK